MQRYSKSAAGDFNTQWLHSLIYFLKRLCLWSNTSSFYVRLPIITSFQPVEQSLENVSFTSLKAEKTLLSERIPFT